MFNEEGEKVKPYYTPKNCILRSNFHSHQNLLTFDNPHQGSQILQLEIHFETHLFILK